MTTEDRIKLFSKELDLIVDDTYRTFAEKLIANAPEYFFRIPASTSGKYHPIFDLGEGGLVRHTKTVIYMTQCLSTSNDIDHVNHDILIISALAHDMIKCGWDQEEHTVTNHPELAAEFVLNLFENEIPMTSMYIIYNCIVRHMGKWGQLKPQTELEKILHSADYIASRRELVELQNVYD